MKEEITNEALQFVNGKILLNGAFQDTDYDIIKYALYHGFYCINNSFVINLNLSPNFGEYIKSSAPKSLFEDVNWLNSLNNDTAELKFKLKRKAESNNMYDSSPSYTEIYTHLLKRQTINTNSENCTLMKKLCPKTMISVPLTTATSAATFTESSTPEAIQESDNNKIKMEQTFNEQLDKIEQEMSDIQNLEDFNLFRTRCDHLKEVFSALQKFTHLNYSRFKRMETKFNEDYLSLANNGNLSNDL